MHKLIQSTMYNSRSSFMMLVVSILGAAAIGCAEPSINEPTTLPNVNLFINRQETSRLIGLENTPIYYVQRGRINNYALGFTIPVSYEQTDLHFTWSNEGPTNVSYAISLTISNLDAVSPPTINITRNGIIPRDEQVFRLSLPCSEKVTADVDVEILINITGMVADSNVDSSDMAVAAATGEHLGDSGGDGTSADDQWPRVGEQPRPVSNILRIRRKKICYVHPVHVAPTATPSSSSSSPANDESVVNADDQNDTDITAPESDQRAPTPRLDAPGNEPTTGTSQTVTNEQVESKSVLPPKPSTNLASTGSLYHNTPVPSMPTQAPVATGINRFNANAFDSSGVQHNSFGRQPSIPSMTNWPKLGPRPVIYDENILENRLIGPNGLADRATNANAGMNARTPVPLALVCMFALILLALTVTLFMIRSHKFPNMFNSVTSLLLGSSAHSGGRSVVHQGSGVIKISPSSAASSASSTSALSSASGKSAFTRSASYYHKNCGLYGDSNAYTYGRHPTADLLGTGYPQHHQTSTHTSCYPYTVSGQMLSQSKASNHQQIMHQHNHNATTTLIWSGQDSIGKDGYILEGSYMPLAPQPPPSTIDGSSVYQSIY